jgi:hypothetical protein
MKRKNPYFVSEKLQKEFQAARRKIASDEKKREKLLRQIAENPSEKLSEKLARIDASIAENTRRLPSENFQLLLATFDNYGLQMLEMIERHDDRLLLTAGDDAPQWQIVNRIQQRRNEIHDSDAENTFEMVTGLDAVIGKLRQIIEEKRAKAAARFPELARQIKPPEYEMPAEYHEFINLLTDLYERRERFAKDLKYATPAKRREVLPMLAEMDTLVDEMEQKLAEVYERHQRKKRYEDEIRGFLKQGSQTDLKELRAHLKKNPTHNGVLERILREEFPE